MSIKPYNQYAKNDIYKFRWSKITYINEFEIHDKIEWSENKI